jgi:hypothetical protein
MKNKKGRNDCEAKMEKFRKIIWQGKETETKHTDNKLHKLQPVSVNSPHRTMMALHVCVESCKTY